MTVSRVLVLAGGLAGVILSGCDPSSGGGVVQTFDCGDWAGTWRGEISGTVTGVPFENRTFEFRLEELVGDNGRVIFPEQEADLGDDQFLVLASPLEFRDGSHTCSNPDFTLTDENLICLYREAGGEFGDACDFTGRLSLLDRQSAGEMSMPSTGDLSPTFSGQGFWTVSPP